MIALYNESEPSAENFTCQKCLKKGHWTNECPSMRKYVYIESRMKEMEKCLKTEEEVEKLNVLTKSDEKFLLLCRSSSSDTSSDSDSSSSSSSFSSSSSSSSSLSSSSSTSSLSSDSSSDSSDSDSKSVKMPKRMYMNKKLYSYGNFKKK